MKNKLMAALETLPMLKKDKEKFVDIIVNNSNNGGGSKLGYLYFKNIPGDTYNYPIRKLFSNLLQMGIMSPIVKLYNKQVTLLEVEGAGGSGIDSTIIDCICIEKFIAGTNLIPFYDIMNVFIEQGLGDIDKSIIEILKANEITEEEFLEGVEFGVLEM